MIHDTNPRATLTTGHAMIDRADAEETIYRVAVSAFTYYHTKAAEELEYHVDEDVQWCLTRLRSLPTNQLDALRAQVYELITDPSADRRAFIATLRELAGE